MKKLFSMLIIFVFVVGIAAAFAGCGPKKPEDNRTVRELDTSLVNVWQGSDGTVYVELKNFEHDGYQFISDSGHSASSIEFSLDGGNSWARREPINDFIDQTGRGIYYIMSSQGDGFTFGVSTSPDGFVQISEYAAGDELSITFRIPQSDTYLASKWSDTTTYTLKAPGTDNSQIFANHYGSSLFDKAHYDFLSTNSFESNGFVVYEEGNSLKFGKIVSEASSIESGMYNYTFTPLEKLTDEDKGEIVKFEYKFLSKIEYKQNITEDSTDLLTSITPDIQTYENNLLMSGAWTDVTGNRFEFNATNNNYIWQYDVEIPNATTGETESYTHTSFVLLVRLKATDSTAHSNVQVLEYQLS